MTKYEMSEPAKRWATWTWLVNSGQKVSYQGTVDGKTIAKRRAANKAARKARRAGR